MDRERAIGISAAGLGLIAIGLTASAIEHGTGELSPPSRSPSDPAASPIGMALELGCPPALRPDVVGLGLVAAVALLTLALVVWRDADGLLLASVALPLTLGFLSICPLQTQFVSQLPALDLPRFGYGRQLLFAVMTLGGVITVTSAVYVWYRLAGSGSTSDEPLQPAEDSDSDLDTIASVAGDAAARIQQPEESSNEVYRAWQEMTQLLDIPDPETSTPADFAQAAVDAGMDPTHVTQLTDLFRAVRYGGSNPKERAERAVEIFERIERTYEETDRADQTENAEPTREGDER